jgi:hypothetical protein
MIMTDAEEARLDRANERKAVALLFLVCGLLMAGGVTFGLITEPANDTPPLELGDLSEAQVVEVRDARGVTVLSGEFRSRVDALRNTEKEAALMDRGGSRVIGEIEIELPPPGRENRRPTLAVDIVDLQPQQTFTIVIDDRAVAMFMSDERGSVDTELQAPEPTPQL